MRRLGLRGRLPLPSGGVALATKFKVSLFKMGICGQHSARKYPQRLVPLLASGALHAGFLGSLNRFYDTQREGGPIMEVVCWPMRNASSSIW